MRGIAVPRSDFGKLLIPICYEFAQNKSLPGKGLKPLVLLNLKKNWYRLLDYISKLPHQFSYRKVYVKSL